MNKTYDLELTNILSTDWHLLIKKKKTKLYFQIILLCKSYTKLKTYFIFHILKNCVTVKYYYSNKCWIQLGNNDAEKKIRHGLRK